MYGTLFFISLPFFVDLCLSLSISAPFPFLGKRKIDLGVGKKNGMCDKLPMVVTSEVCVRL